ncbi:NAD+ synthase (glutamine-hydrolysing) [Pseudoduganella lurida]|uniref:Glutamine-dependent NAD(+) synthetase n=1 Tax=Pseudoduganella lurida TaxID=1036180 RepID=A0A562RNY4_9BURK|nr:NAD(+) synthase [Pseudoduganella lurida]TWI70076.1 NAD+ synthase (glutamine-hydrolysing) [Pseudoduganella lurida]
MPHTFHNLYSHDFVRVAVGVPRCRVADPLYNAEQTVALAEQAAAKGALLVAFPELGLSAYTCDDLFHQRALLESVQAALAKIVEASIRLPVAMIVGMPLKVDHRLFNCAVVVSNGRIHGVVPKIYLPNYNEFYEVRQFSSADEALSTEIELLDQRVPFGADLLFQVANLPLLRFHAEICEDVWVPIPPSSYAALAGATVLVNLSASNIVVGKSDYRHQLVGQQSGRCMAAYLYSSAGRGESSTDLAWDGQALIYENGELLAEAERFQDDSHVIFADVDLERLSRDRMRTNTWGDSMRRHAPQIEAFRVVKFVLEVPSQDVLPLQRSVARFPYVPANPAVRDKRCMEVYNIQVQALVQRLSAIGMKKVVIGISGGLDSTHALLVCAKAMDRLNLPRTNILAYTMPGFATSRRTLEQARKLMDFVGCTAHEIDIRPSCIQMLKDIGHPYSEGAEQYDVTFENVQAGERTSHLFRLANHHNGIVIGTGDLSELALGWCTYGVGDHMSHYNVNASVPKTLISHLVRWVAGSRQFGAADSQVLLDVVDTEISPELVPGKASDTAPAQSTQSYIGPYELQDFNLYYLLRFGFEPSKIAFLALHAWKDAATGAWPDDAHVVRNDYSLKDIKHNLGIFLRRFFQSQFKRTCVPNAPKVGSGGSLSPRGDWRAPSDAESVLWLENLKTVPDA